MPFSFSAQLSTVVGFIEEVNPMSVLDVGVGMGQYGYLTRMNLENVDLFDIDGANSRLKEPSEWARRIDGIEAFPLYINAIHQYVYNEIRIGNALEILPTLSEGSYDLVLAIDIVEHFEKNEGVRFLEEVKRVARKRALVATPKEWTEQEAEANPYENHRSHWNEQDLRNQGFDHVLPNPVGWIAVWTRATE